MGACNIEPGAESRKEPPMNAFDGGNFISGPSTVAELATIMYIKINHTVGYQILIRMGLSAYESTPPKEREVRCHGNVLNN